MPESKYRQRGYQDSEPRDRSFAHGPDSPRGQREGPRGRGFGKPTVIVLRCAVCGYQHKRDTVAVDATCGDCGADLHTCTHCASLDSAARWQCRKPIEAPIGNKAQRNGCGSFAAKVSQELGTSRCSATDARSAFDALFDS